MKLTDTQLVLLSAASQREDGAVVLAPNLKGGAASKVVGKLLLLTLARRSYRSSVEPPSKVRHLSDIDGDPPRLVAGEELGRRASPRLVLRKEYARSP
jgi:hypothetical protein